MGWLPVDNRVAESSFLWLVEALLAFWAFLLPREVPVVFLGFCADMLSLCSFKSVVWSLSIIILCLIVVWFYLKTFFMSLTWIIWVSLVPDGWTVHPGWKWCPLVCFSTQSVFTVSRVKALTLYHMMNLIASGICLWIVSCCVSLV